MANIRIYQKHNKNVVNGVVTEKEEHVIFGDKGLKFKLFIRNNNDKERIIGKIDENGKYRLININNEDKKVEEDLSYDDLLKLVKKNKSLAFVTKFLDASPKKKGGSKKVVKRKGSKKN